MEARSGNGRGREVNGSEVGAKIYGAKLSAMIYGAEVGAKICGAELGTKICGADHPATSRQCGCLVGSVSTPRRQGLWHRDVLTRRHDPWRQGPGSRNISKRA